MRTIAAVLAIVCAGAAVAQTTPTAGAVRRSAASATQAPATTTPAPTTSAAGVSAAPAVLSTPATTSNATPSLGAVMTMDDNATVVANGQDVRVGDVKREVWAALKDASGSPPPMTVKRATPGTDIPAASLGTSASSILGTNAQETAKHACDDQTPWISRIEGSVTSGGRFTIKGACFGAQPGKVELIGNLPSDAQRAAFEEWTNGRIVAVMPRVSGAVDGTVAVTVIGSSGNRSAAKQAAFFVERVSVAVPAERWRPANRVYQAPKWTNDIGLTKDGETQLHVSVNPACWLDVAFANSRVGTVRTVAWLNEEPSKPHEGGVEVGWQTSCVNKRTSKLKWFVYVPYADTDEESVCAVDVVVDATAQCPVGVQP